MKTTYENPKPWIVNYRNYKKFCNATFRQILLEKLSIEKIKSVEGEEIIDVDRENTENLNTFFSNAAKNLKISEY